MTGTDLRQILSKNLKALRNQKSLSQIELAEKANISIPFLSNIERSNKWPHPDTLVKLAKALEVEIYVLFLERPPPLPDNVQAAVAAFKRDISTSLRKAIPQAIDFSLETISTHYTDGKQEKPEFAHELSD